MSEVPANELSGTDAVVRAAATLGKIADVASSAMTEAVANSVKDKTSAAMNDLYAVATHSLYHIKIQTENLERALELKRKQAVDEVEAFVAAAAEAENYAISISKVLTALETTALATATPATK